jgi:hypothetical protein
METFTLEDSIHDLKRGDKLMIKTMDQMLNEGFERLSFGLLKHRASRPSGARQEVFYASGMEKDLRVDRVVTFMGVGAMGLSCKESAYLFPKEAIMCVDRVQLTRQVA